jgi:hypothetical protein
VTTCQGVGKIALSVAATVAHQTAMIAASTSSEGAILFRRSAITAARQSASSAGRIQDERCSQCRARQRNVGHPLAGPGSTMTFIAPLACAVQAKL